jgi:hypothetical protein
MDNKLKQKKYEPILSELTLRKYEKPSKDITTREIIRRICCSIGLLQPDDSRDIIVDIFQSIIEAKRPIKTKEIIGQVKINRSKNNLVLYGLTYPNVCRQLRRLKQLHLIDVKADKYRLNENDSLRNIFNQKIMNYHLISIKKRINEYINLLEKNN